MNPPKIRIPVLAATLLIIACAKNPFSTRDTETPYGSVGTWETPYSPEVALRNLLFAYNEKVISNYQLCLADSFLFSSPEDSIDAVNDGRGDLFENWTRQTEIGVTENIFSTFSSSDSLALFLILNPTPEYVDIVEDTSAVLYRGYILTLIASDSSASDTVTARGLATFHLSQEQLNWWTIFLWEDLPAVSGQTDWGDIKVEYRR